MPLNLTDFNQFYVINKICGQAKTAPLSGVAGVCSRGQDFDSKVKKFLRFSITEAKKNSTPF